MAKTKAKKSKAMRPKGNQKQVARVPRGPALDAYAMAYARLLYDPCGAPLVHPTYAGTDGGLLVRAENTYTIGANTGITAGVFSWTPGGIGAASSGTISSAIAQGESTIPGGAILLAGVSSGYQPGYGFLSANASEARCVAACIQIFYTGTEVGRSGLVAYGNIIGGTLPNGLTCNSQGVLTLFENFERTPDRCVEVKWRPTNFDQNYTVPSATTSITELSRRGALAFAFKDLQPGVGITVRMVGVYEYTPAFNIGLTSAIRSRSISNNSLDQVVNYLDRLGDWTTRAVNAAGSLVGAMYTANGMMRQISYGGTRSRMVTG